MKIKTLIENFMVVKTLINASEGLSFSNKRKLVKMDNSGQKEIDNYVTALNNLVEPKGLEVIKQSSLLTPRIELKDKEKQKIYLSAYFKKEKERNPLEVEVYNEFFPKIKEIQKELEEEVEKETSEEIIICELTEEEIEKIRILEKRKKEDATEYDVARELFGYEISFMENLGMIK